MKRDKGLYKNNQGSTLVVVITIIAFLSILVVIVTQSAAINYKMKIINKQSQKVFYTSEDAVDEIYAALGKTAMECFDRAYNEEISKVVYMTEVGGNKYPTKVLSNLVTNRNLRKNFAGRLLTELKILDKELINRYDQTSFVMTYNSEEERKRFTDVLNSYLEDKNGLKVKNVKTIALTEKQSQVEGVADLKNYILEFTDCHVEYINESGYYSNIYFDAKVAMPDVYVDFSLDVNNSFKSFTKYALIGNSGVIINNNNTLNLKGNIYAGKKNGVLVKTDSVFNTLSDINIISGGDVTVNGGTFYSKNADIWCTGIIVESDKKASEVDINGSMFVKDDLQIEADNSKVTLAGDYYGYSYQGFSNAEVNHSNSSSMIVNGEKSTLNIAGLNLLVLGGRAYIDYEAKDGNYTTGESLSFAGSQEMYLVPSYLMNKTNPVVENKEDVTVNLKDTNFFGFEYLNPVVPYEVREYDGATYYYLKFKNDSEIKKYVKALFDDEEYKKIIQGKNEETVKEYDRSRVYMQTLVNANLNKKGSTVISVSDKAAVYTNGQMINAVLKDGIEAQMGKTDENYEVSNTVSTDGFVLNAWDLSNRYKLMTTILAMPSFTDDSGNRNYLGQNMGNIFTIDGENVNISTYAQNNMFDNIVHTDGFSDLLEESMEYGKITDDGILLYAVVNSSAIVISDDEDSVFKGHSTGIIVAKGDVIVKKDFSGLIISGGNIEIDNSQVTIQGRADIKDILEDDGNSDFANIFKAYNPSVVSETNGSFEGIGFDDFVEFTNWRKSE